MSDASEKFQGGYLYDVTDEAILKYMEWSIETRLKWLEEANYFLALVLPDEARRIREKFRRGGIQVSE